MRILLLCILLFCQHIFSRPATEAFTSLVYQAAYRHRSQPPNKLSVLEASVDGSSSTSNEKAKPWDFFRFVSQSSKFLTPPRIPFLGSSSDRVTRKISPGEVLWTSSSSQNIFSFAPLDDVVMGGASSSTVDNNTGLWTGKVTDANNGGFVGIRSTPFKNGVSLDMSDCKGIQLRLRQGNGKRFKFIVRDSTEFNGICWTTSFDSGRDKRSPDSFSFAKTDDQSGTTIRILFAKQLPTIFARSVSGKVFNIKNIVGFQLTYSKFEYDGRMNENFALGDFSLQILDIKSF